jgi:hypothetical protein
MANEEDVAVVPGGVWLVSGADTEDEKVHYALGPSIDLLRQMGAQFVAGPEKDASGHYTLIDDPRPAMEAAALLAQEATPPVTEEAPPVEPAPVVEELVEEPAAPEPEPAAEEVSETPEEEAAEPESEPVESTPEPEPESAV